MLNAVPLFIPVAFPPRLSVDEPRFFIFRKIPVRDVHSNMVPTGELEHVFIAGTIGFGHPGFDGAVFKTKRLIGNNQRVVNANDSAETSTGFTSAQRRVETKGRICRFVVIPIAIVARQFF